MCVYITMDKTIGIAIKKGALFTNGCIQQAYFLHKLLGKAGIRAEFVTTDQGFNEFDVGGIPVRVFAHDTPTEVLDRFSCILYLSAVIQDAVFTERCKQLGVALVYVICGNMWSLHLEDYVFKRHGILDTNMNTRLDAVCLMEMYREQKSYIETLYRCPATITPHVWDDDIVLAHMAHAGLSYTPPPGAHDRRIVFFVFEPNMSTHKTSHIPLLIADMYNAVHGDRVVSVEHYCGTEVHEMKHLPLTRKIRTYPRKWSAEAIVTTMSQHPDAIPVILSHHFHNELNFLHLEMMTLGIPIVHNCDPYQGNGMWYTDTDLQGTTATIEKARTGFDPTAYIARCKPIVERYGTDNPSNQQAYTQVLRSILGDFHKPHHPMYALRYMHSEPPAPPTPAPAPAPTYIVRIDAIRNPQPAMILASVRSVEGGATIEVYHGPGYTPPVHTDVRYRACEHERDIGAAFEQPDDAFAMVILQGTVLCQDVRVYENVVRSSAPAKAIVFANEHGSRVSAAAVAHHVNAGRPTDVPQNTVSNFVCGFAGALHTLLHTGTQMADYKTWDPQHAIHMAGVAQACYPGLGYVAASKSKVCALVRNDPSDNSFEIVGSLHTFHDTVVSHVRVLSPSPPAHLRIGVPKEGCTIDIDPDAVTVQGDINLASLPQDISKKLQNLL